jgi:hypothetical protein
MRHLLTNLRRWRKAEVPRKDAKESSQDLQDVQETAFVLSILYVLTVSLFFAPSRLGVRQAVPFRIRLCILQP